MAGKQKLLPAYLIVGEDELKRARALERLRARVAQMGDLEFNHDQFDGENADGGDIAISCNTLPFASDLRLVEVKNGEKLGKASMEVITAYLTAPNESTVFAFSCNKLAKNTRLYKAFSAIGKNAVIDCAPMKRYELARALRSMAVEHGFTMTEAAASRLLELVGEDTVKLDSELRKIALSLKGAEVVSEKTVESLVTRSSDAKPWELVDAFCERDLKRCISLVDVVDDTPIGLISKCTARLRELSCAKALVARGESHALAQTLGVPSWRVKNHVRWSRNFTEAELRSAFSQARDCERMLKSTSQGEAAFKNWLMETIA